jgi:hypothetical protein
VAATRALAPAVSASHDAIIPHYSQEQGAQDALEAGPSLSRNSTTRTGNALRVMASLRNLAIRSCACAATATSPVPTATTPATRSGRSRHFKLHEYDFAGSLPPYGPRLVRNCRSPEPEFPRSAGYGSRETKIVSQVRLDGPGRLAQNYGSDAHPSKRVVPVVYRIGR